MPASQPAPATVAPPAILALVAAARQAHPTLDVRESGTATAAYGYDATRRALAADPTEVGPTVVLPANAAEVQTVVRLAGEHGVTVVPRGAGSGLSGGAIAAVDQLVLSTERMDRIVEISVDDEVAVVEPGVFNSALNDALRPHGYFYAPDPASHDISTIGGNIATNAGGLHCAKYGVTRESVLALDVVLADGELISVGHRSIKGVAGLDLASLFVGSEGTLGIVVGATLRLHRIPVAQRTLSVFFASTAAGLDAFRAIRRTPVRPAAVEFFDAGSLTEVDRQNGTRLTERGAALALIELDGYGIDAQTADIVPALEAAGGIVTVESDADAAALWELRRCGKGVPEGVWFTSGDIAVPVSRFAEIFAEMPKIGERFGVTITAIAHAGDGNLHPSITKPLTPGADPAANPPELHDAMTALVEFALSIGGTATGEHGLGTVKREYAELELSPRNLAAQHAVKRALDPRGTLNPDTGY